MNELILKSISCKTANGAWIKTFRGKAPQEFDC